ncbi:hypothetical protein [Turneriella parva]|nr:hypothetical protein [Turneriella parva]
MGAKNFDHFLAEFSYPVRFFFILTIGTLCWVEPFFLPENSIGGVTAIVAQGHFLLGYLYQYKAGKMNQAYAMLYLPVAVLLFGASIFLPVERLIYVLAATYFLVHYFYDERYLLKERAEFSGWKITLPTIAVLFAETLYRYAGLRYALLLQLAFVVSAAYMLWLILSEILRIHRLSARNWYFLATFCIAATLTLSGKAAPGSLNPNALNFLILMHCANWYWRYVEKFSADRKLLRRFSVETVIINLFLGVLMFFRFHSSYSVFVSALAGVLFVHPYFQVWSLLHFVVTYRPADNMNWIPMRASA